MIGATTTGPSTAERVRSACARAEGAALAIEGSEPVVTTLHHLRSNGEVVLAVPSDSATGAIAWQSTRAGVPAVLELTDHAPLALREPVRSLVWLRGELRPVPESLMRPMAGAVAAEHPHPALLDVGHSTVLLRLILTSAVVADSTGAEPVAVDDLLSAEPDPFWEMETSWLQHLDEDMQISSTNLPDASRRRCGRDASDLSASIDTASGCASRATTATTTFASVSPNPSTTPWH
jgi:hypothetical protein